MYRSLLKWELPKSNNIQLKKYLLFLILYSDLLRARRLGFETRWRQGILFCLKNPSRPAVGSTQPSIQWVMGFFPGGKVTSGWCWTPNLHLVPRFRMGSYTILSPVNLHGVFYGDTYLMILVNNQLDLQFFMYVYFYSLHVSGSHMPIIRRFILSMRHLVFSFWYDPCK